MTRLRERAGPVPIEKFCDGYRAGEIYLMEALTLRSWKRR
jgi:hypothetical protein